jgi:hypothetical protein
MTRMTDRRIWENEFYAEQHESFKDVDYRFKNGKDELKVHVDLTVGGDVDAFWLNNIPDDDPHCILPEWARDILVGEYYFLHKSERIKRLLEKK